MLNNIVPSLQCHYNKFITTTNDSATVCCIDTLALRGHRFRLLSSHQHDSFPSSSQKPDKRSRLLYAGCHRISKQFSFRFISAIVRVADFDNGLDITTPHQRFTCVRLRLSYLPNLFRLFFNAHDNDSLSLPLEVVCNHLLQSECGGPATISCEVT